MKFNKNKYQLDFSKALPGVLNENKRRLKANKMISVIEDYLHKNNRKMFGINCLDIGGSAGFVAKLLSKRAARVTIIDIDKNALNIGKKINCAKNIKYQLADAMNLPFKDNTFDLIICNQVYEHVPSAERLISEIYRVLNEEGICYFGAVNKYDIIEKHYKLPFLSWLPRNIANKYLKLFRKIEYYEMPLSYFELKKLFKRFKMIDYSHKIVKNPAKFYSSDVINPHGILTRFPEGLLKVLIPIMPSFVFILVKEGKNGT
jgi:ubiquinone/menaquinone biosynthesis C-methylase UbiE